MQCSECDTSDAQLFQVTFSEDRVDEVALCDDCRNKFENADLVSEIISTENFEKSEEMTDEALSS